MSLSDLNHNPDAMAWTNEFRATFPDCPIDDGTMLAWFANAMMAIYDSKVNPLHSRIAELEAERGAAYEAGRASMREEAAMLASNAGVMWIGMDIRRIPLKTEVGR